MVKSKQYIRKHTKKEAFLKHQKGLKKRNAVIDKIQGMTIYYHFKD